MARARREERQELTLSEAAQTLLDECRMVLPGIQALFGFQLIAVFNDRFARELNRFDQCLHFAAISLVALAIGSAFNRVALRVTSSQSVLARSLSSASSMMSAVARPNSSAMRLTTGASLRKRLVT